MDERRVNGLCYYCDEKFVVGHQCKRHIAFMIVGEDHDEGVYDLPSIYDEEPLEESVEITSNEGNLKESTTLTVISNGNQSLTLRGKVGDVNIVFLVDGGSSLSFLSREMAEKLNCPLEAIKPMAVSLPAMEIITLTLRC